MKIVCFHNPEEENGYLSNWYSSQFIINDIIFSSMEQFMMYQKAICFEDNDIAQKILKTENVAYIKELGRLISNYNENYWNGIRQIIVFEGLMAKFSQNESLKRQLQETEHCIFLFRPAAGGYAGLQRPAASRIAQAGSVCLRGRGEFCQCFYAPASLRTGQSHAPDGTVSDTDRLLPQCGFPAARPEDAG